MRYCATCHKKFFPTSNRQIYCTDDCLAESFIIRKNLESQNYHRLSKNKLQSKYKTLNCVICSNEFHQKSVNQICCSKKCSVLRNHEICALERKEKLRGIYVERKKTYYFRCNLIRSDFEKFIDICISKNISPEVIISTFLEDYVK